MNYVLCYQCKGKVKEEGAICFQCRIDRIRQKRYRKVRNVIEESDRKDKLREKSQQEIEGEIQWREATVRQSNPSIEEEIRRGILFNTQQEGESSTWANRVTYGNKENQAKAESFNAKNIMLTDQINDLQKSLDNLEKDKKRSEGSFRVHGDQSELMPIAEAFHELSVLSKDIPISEEADLLGGDDQRVEVEYHYQLKNYRYLLLHYEYEHIFNRLQYAHGALINC